MKSISTVLVILILNGLSNAADYHLTPTGAGNRGGTGWNDAFDQQALGRAVNEVMQPGDRLLVSGGNYQNVGLAITNGGKQGSPKWIMGVDRGEGLPVFSGEWSEESPAKGTTALRFGDGVSHVVVEALRIKGHASCVHAPAVKGGPPRTGLVFRDVDMERFRHGFHLADCDDLLLTGCDLKRYSKHAFRFDQGCDRVTLRNCAADCSEGDAEWEKKTELFPFGFFINDGGAPNTDFVFEDCVSRNNLMPLQKNRYKNGDGFVVEGNTKDVTFIRCRSIRNQDGGFDLKVPGVKLVDCVSTGNSRSFRIWKSGALTNCFAGWGKNGLWSNGGPVTASRCTFHAMSDAAVLTDDLATRPVELIDCIVSGSARLFRKTSSGDVKMILPATAEDPEYERPDPAWDGEGNAMDSRTFPDKGYRSDSK